MSEITHTHTHIKVRSTVAGLVPVLDIAVDLRIISGLLNIQPFWTGPTANTQFFQLAQKRSKPKKSNNTHKYTYSIKSEPIHFNLDRIIKKLYLEIVSNYGLAHSKPLTNARYIGRPKKCTKNNRFILFLLKIVNHDIKSYEYIFSRKNYCPFRTHKYHWMNTHGK